MTTTKDEDGNIGLKNGQKKSLLTSAEKKLICMLVALLAVGSMLFAQEPIVIDLSKMQGSQSEPTTNKLILYPALLSSATNYIDQITNGWEHLIVPSNYLKGTIESMIERGELTNVIKRLVMERHICAVIGHKWQFGCGITGCCVIHHGMTRHCVICAKVETQEVSDWK